MNSDLKIYTILSSFMIFCVSCRMNKDQVTGESVNSKPAMVHFTDSINAAKLISTVDDDGLFDQISQIDIEIQMKKEQAFESREHALSAYKKFLSTEVSSWSDEEIVIMNQIFSDAKKLCDTISPRIFPGGIKLIKIKPNHYGRDVYYTRGNIIFIPENIFPIENQQTILSVMLHEIFHIVSRQNSELRSDIYKLIGFAKAEKQVKLNEMLNKKLLTNPDGVSYQYFIRLDSILAIPLITSNLAAYRKNTPSFFNYLQFDLYQIHDKGTYYEAITDEKGNTTIPLKKTPVFFTKIKDNTQYIIHPDEIMADNFMFAVLAFSNDDYNRFSGTGKVLIKELLTILRKF
ncbi:MAG: hypothetical protein IPK35_12670 [Saprospiraceae bacterium]|nr:hypothetical protein [Saprospiraceae bacterium]